MINLPTKILLAIKPMRTQFKFTLRLICTPEYKYTPEYIYTRVFFAHANWTLESVQLSFLSLQNKERLLQGVLVGLCKHRHKRRTMKWSRLTLAITPQPLYNTVAWVQVNFCVSYSIHVISRVKCMDK